MTESRKQRTGQSKKGSSILNCFNKLSAWIAKKAKSGLFGTVFGSYTKANKKMQAGLMSSLVGKNSRVSGIAKKLRLIVSDQFERSKILKLLNRITKFFLLCKLRLYSAFFLTFGIYTGLVYFLKRFIMLQSDVSESLLTFAGVAVIISIPLLFTNKNLAEALRTSKAGYFIVSDVFGVPDEKLDVVTTKHGRVYNLAIFMGVVLGTLTYFIDPEYIVALIVIFAIITLIVTFPEIGVVTVIALLPILSVKKIEFMLMSVIALYVFGYFIKLIRGKRVISFEIIDISVLFFMLLILANGSQTSNSAEITKMIVLLIGAFTAGKLVRIKIWQVRCLIAAILSGTVMSMMIIWQRITELTGDFFGYSFLIFERGTVPFFNGNIQIISLFLIACLIFNFAMFYSKNGAKQKVILVLNCMLLLGSLVLLGSTFYIICGLCALLVFFFIMSYNTLTVVLLGSAVAVTGALVVPQNIKSQIASAVFKDNIASFISTIKVWDGSIELLKATLFTGVGVGGFKSLYPIYAMAGAEGVLDCGSLWIRMLCELGVPGVLVLILILFLFIQNCCEYLKRPLGTAPKASVAAGMSCVIFLIAMSFVCDIFSNSCMYYVFWLLISTVCAGIISDRAEMEKNAGYTVNTEYAATVSV